MNKILCRVVTEPVYNDKICIFKVEAQGKIFIVVSQKQQAVKDNIFVTNRQKIEIEGEIVDDIIYTRKSIIKLN